jgi:hypothetical protein
MGQIYSGAQHVFACVGQHADDSEYLGTILRRHSALFNDIYSSIKSNTRFSVYQVAENPTSERTRMDIRCLLIMKAFERERLFRAFISLMRRPYFKRVWVLQELYLARKGSYYFGMTVQSFESLLALDRLLDFWLVGWYMVPISWLRLASRMVQDIPVSRRVKACMLMDGPLSQVIAERKCLDLASQTQVLPELASVLHVVDKFQCADLHDKLYGILSLVDWSRTPKPTPNYDKDSFQLAIDTLSLLSSLDLVYSLIRWAMDILLLFEVTWNVTSLREALELRSGLLEETLIPKSDRLDTAHHIYHPWFGVKISDHHGYLDGFEEDGKNTRCSRREPNDGFTVLYDHLGGISAYAPLDTRAGDWLVSNHELCARWNGLIVRNSGEEQYSIVGPTVIPTLKAVSH